MASIPEVGAGWDDQPPYSPLGSKEARAAGREAASVRTWLAARTSSRPTWTAFVAAVIAVGLGVSGVMYERSTPTAVEPTIAAHLSDAQQALIDRHYIEPADASAIHYYELVLALDPNNRAAREGIDRIASRVLADAEALIPRDKLADAAVAIESIRRVRPAHPQLPRVEALLRQQQERLVLLARQEMIPVPRVAPVPMTAKAPTAKPTSPTSKTAAPFRDVDALQNKLEAQQQGGRKDELLQLVLQRTQANHLMEPLRDSATDYLQQLARIDRRSQAYQRALDALGTRLVANARTAIYQENFEHAAKLLNHARSLGFNSAELESADGTVRTALQNPKQPLTAAQLRRRIRFVEPEFPAEARRTQDSGWVDVTLSIAPNGSVVNAHVKQASVPVLFDRAALSAVRKWRYEPRPSSGRKDFDVVDVRLEFKK